MKTLQPQKKDSAMYARCINNQQYLKHPDFEVEETIYDLVIGRIYKIIPDATEEELGYLRIVNESGEDYTFLANYFEALELNPING